MFPSLMHLWGSMSYRFIITFVTLNQNLPNLTATSQTVSSQPVTSSNSPSNAPNVEPLKPVDPETHLK